MIAPVKDSGFGKALTSAVWACVVKAGWLPALVLGIHGVALLFLDVYAVWPAFDIPMHFVGGLTIAFVALRCVDVFVERGLIQRLNRVVEWVLVFGLTAVAVVHWEFAEWLVDALFAVGSQRSLDDTILDMLLGLVGGIVVVVLSAPKRLRTD